MTIQIQLRRGTAAQWTSANPTLAAGELGVETDTDLFKLGDGATAWSSLAYGGVKGEDADLDTALTGYSAGSNTALTSSDTILGAFGKCQGQITARLASVGDSDVLGVKATFNNQTGTTYEVASGDNAKLVTCNNGSAITVTLPNALSIGFQCAITQLGDGQVTFSAEAGGALLNRQSHTKTAGKYGTISVFVVANAGGSAAQWLLVGDTSA